jgi:hypothetical protein
MVAVARSLAVIKPHCTFMADKVNLAILLESGTGRHNQSMMNSGPA